MKKGVGFIFFGIITIFIFANCGDSGVVCGTENDNIVNCNGICVDISSDKNNCGGCGHVCGEGQICQDGKCVDECVPQPEDCNGIDDDCNGIVDDNIPPRPCSTPCGTGTERCVDGQWVGCNAPQPEEEICDGKDNDCDGEVDETCECVHGQFYPCGRGDERSRQAMLNRIGICEPGQAYCNMGHLEECIGGVEPAPREDCSNNLDDDCDGTVNEGCECTAGQTQPCGSDVGECEPGIQECVGGVQPVQEVCDGRDNDCDGIIDNGLVGDSLENNNQCESRRDLPVSNEVSDIENPPEDSFPVIEASIYLQGDEGPQGDVDWYWFRLEEAFHWCWPTTPQCYGAVIGLVSPPGKDYRFCVLPSFESEPNCESFTDDNIYCTEDDNCSLVEDDNGNQVQVCQLFLVWGGSCGGNDSINILAKVFGNDPDNDYSCENYQFYYYMASIDGSYCSGDSNNNGGDDSGDNGGGS